MGGYRAGSLPNVNQMSSGHQNSHNHASRGSSGNRETLRTATDLQTALNHLEELKSGRDQRDVSPRGSRRNLISHGRTHSAHNQHHSGSRGSYHQRIDTSPHPYSPTYLSPPPDTSWRRTNSDSALHTSGLVATPDSANPDSPSSSFFPNQGSPHNQFIGGCGQSLSAQDSPGSACSDIENQYLDHSASQIHTPYLHLVTSTANHHPDLRPRSCDVPGITIVPTEEEPNGLMSGEGGGGGLLNSTSTTGQGGHHITANTGSLPDLTNFHSNCPPPLQTPIDADDQTCSQQQSHPQHQHQQQRHPTPHQQPSPQQPSPQQSPHQRHTQDPLIANTSTMTVHSPTQSLPQDHAQSPLAQGQNQVPSPQSHQHQHPQDLWIGAPVQIPSFNSNYPLMNNGNAALSPPPVTPPVTLTTQSGGSILLQPGGSGTDGQVSPTNGSYFDKFSPDLAQTSPDHFSKISWRCNMTDNSPCGCDDGSDLGQYVTSSAPLSSCSSVIVNSVQSGAMMSSRVVNTTALNNTVGTNNSTLDHQRDAPSPGGIDTDWFSDDAFRACLDLDFEGLAELGDLTNSTAPSSTTTGGPQDIPTSGALTDPNSAFKN